MQTLAGDVRTQYRAWIILTWVCTVAAAILMLGVHPAFLPLDLPAAADADRRLAARGRPASSTTAFELDTHDEMAELAEAMNDMTARFQAIRDDLDRQVQERTKQVVRSEQLASVGFLAAGVAHEINNPLASIALCAESLESRLPRTAATRPTASTPK